MNINYLTNISFDGRIKKPKLLPASSYNGPKLQLTEIDVKRISELEALKKAEMEKQAPVLRNLDIYLHKNLSSDKREEIRMQKNKIKSAIEFYDKEIQNIKKERIAQQRADWEAQKKNQEDGLDINA